MHELTIRIAESLFPHENKTFEEAVAIEDINEKIEEYFKRCPDCGSIDATDSTKEGIPMKSRYFCHNCGRMWGGIV